MVKTSIGGLPLIISRGGTSPDNWGEYQLADDLVTQLVRVADEVPDSRVLEVLLHEILHAIADNCHMEFLEHDRIQTIALLLAQVLAPVVKVDLGPRSAGGRREG